VFASLFSPEHPIEWRPRSHNSVLRGHGRDSRLVVRDLGVVTARGDLAVYRPGDLFGVVAALSRGAHSATVVALEPTEVLEMRRQAVRELRRRNETFRNLIDGLYRERGLNNHLRSLPLLAALDDKAIRALAASAEFESFGDFEWHLAERGLRDRAGAHRMAAEPVICRAGDQADSLILVRAGFVRVSEPFGDGERTLSYDGGGASVGLAELARNRGTDSPLPRQQSVRAVGYADVIRIPARAAEEHILPALRPEQIPPLRKAGAGAEAASTAQIDAGFMEFASDQRLINGRHAMMIDLERCVRCDDCVRACAATHGGNPRFERTGRRHGRYQITHACMHCADPVCLIGCPTGAIGRDRTTGNILIDEAICIGCSVCAESCPYDNITMVAPSSVAAEANETGLLATKCDLCSGLPGGPACARSCPHDALTRIDLLDLPALARWMER